MKTRIFKLLALLLLSLPFVACDDDSPANYIREVYVEGYLIVDEPVEGIIVTYTQPVNEKYDEDKAMIKDADVKITGDGKELTLVYDADKREYLNPDRTYLVKPNTEYKLEIRLKDGKVLTGTTLTPVTFNWVKPPKDVMHFPKDTIKMESPDSISIEWEGVPDKYYFLMRITCLDTLDYGRYLNPPTSEMNRRCKNVFGSGKENDWMYKNTSSWGFLANSKSPAVWFAFKWFGKHEIAVMMPDNNMLNWFINNFFTGTSYNEPKLNSIKGGIGVFGSASYIKDETFIIKNQL